MVARTIEMEAAFTTAKVEAGAEVAVAGVLAQAADLAGANAPPVNVQANE